ncbi:hypothetical protein [Clostridium tagluense]|uniref:Uncharacterized protein n=1 Tax=Clostridium tagluense TaxID=360422 RepID=A0A401UQ58_9CLOT|nr:hypothetical protein [Clostridium tagluense]GCD11664.1 hypothetical protein Ctaglu_32870 [Clostridium tagluense]
MELQYYLDKAIDEYLGKMGTITTKKIMNYIYSEYNQDANLEDVSSILKERATILEIVDGIFVGKNDFLSFVDGIDTCLLKSQIEFQYFVSINEDQMAKILDMVKFYKNKEHYGKGRLSLYSSNEFENNDNTMMEDKDEAGKNIIKKRDEIEGEKNEIKWTYSKVIEFGMEYGYINSSWVESIDYNLEKEVQDFFETIEDIEEKGIKVKYIVDGDKLCN